MNYYFYYVVIIYIYFNQMKQIYIEQNEEKWPSFRLIVSMADTCYSGPIFIKFYMPFIYIQNPGK